MFVPVFISLCVIKSKPLFRLWFCMAMHWVHFIFHLMNNWNLFLINNTTTKSCQPTNGDKDAFSMCLHGLFGEWIVNTLGIRASTTDREFVSVLICMWSVYVPFVSNYTMHCGAPLYTRHCWYLCNRFSHAIEIKICLQSINGRAHITATAVKQNSVKSFIPNSRVWKKND